MGFRVATVREIRAERRGRESFVPIKRRVEEHGRTYPTVICRGKERSWRKSRERMREEGRHRSLMPILQPVQRGLVFRRARRSAGAFCHPFKPTVAMINKHDMSSWLSHCALFLIRSICNARSVAKKCYANRYIRRARKRWGDHGRCSRISNRFYISSLSEN